MALGVICTATLLLLPYLVFGQNFKSIYDEGLAFYNNKEFEKAKSSFAKAVKATNDLESAGTAQYMIGICCIQLNDYDCAVQELKKVQTYKGFSKIPDATFKLGAVYMTLKDYGHAKFEFTKIIVFFPESELVEDAKTKLDEIDAANNPQNE